MADIVVALVAGLPAYVIVKILNPGFFAREDMKTPVWTALAALIVNIAINLYVVSRYGIVGLAGATAVSASLNCLLLRSEEHTSELQSLMRISYAVFCLKKKKLSKIQEDNL